MGKKTEKASKPIGYQDIRRLFGRATQATQATATPAAAPARPAARPNRQPSAPVNSHAAPTAAAAAPPAVKAAAQATTAGKVSRASAAPAAAAGAGAGKRAQRPAAPAGHVSATTAPAQQQPQKQQQQQADKPGKAQQAPDCQQLMPAQQQPAQAAQKRAGAHATAAEAAAAHAAKAAAARAAKAQGKEASATAAAGSRPAHERSVAPAADPAPSSSGPATKSNSSSRSGSVPPASGNSGPGQGVNSKPSKLGTAASATAGAADAGPGSAGAAEVRNIRAAVRGSAARGPGAAVAADSMQQHRPGSALFGNCMGLQAGGQMVMSQYEDMPEVQWEPSPPKLALLSAAHRAASGGAANREVSAGTAASGAASSRSVSVSGLADRRGKSRSKSPTPASMQIDQAGDAGAAGGSSGGAMPPGRQAANKTRMREGSTNSGEDGGNKQQGSRQGTGGSTKQLPELAHAKQSSKPNGNPDDSDDVLQQVLASIGEPCAGPSVLATPGGPRLRAFKQHSVLPPSSGGGSSCRKLQRQQRRSSAGTATALAAAAAAGAAAAGTPGTAEGASAGAGSTGSALRLAAAGVSGSTPSSSTAKKQQAGLKRRVLLELLEKVQDLVKKPRLDGSSSDDGQDSIEGDGSHGGLPVVQQQQLLKGGEGARGDAANGADDLLEAVLAEVGHAPRQRSQQEQAGTQAQRQSQQQQGVPAAAAAAMDDQQAVLPTQVVPGILAPPAAAAAAAVGGAACEHKVASTAMDIVEATQDPVQATLCVPGPGTASAAGATAGSVAAAAAAVAAGGSDASDVAAVEQDGVRPNGVSTAGGLEAADSQGPDSVPATMEEVPPADLDAEPTAAVAAGESGTGAAGAGAQAPAAAAAGAAAAAEGVTAPDGGVLGRSQEGRARAAAKELADFELLYGDMDDLLASQTHSQQQQHGQQQHGQQQHGNNQQQGKAGNAEQQQQQQQQGDSQDEFDLLDAVLAEIEVPAAKRQKLQQHQQQQQQPQSAVPQAGATGTQPCGPHAAAVAAAAHATGQDVPNWTSVAAGAAAQGDGPGVNEGQAAAADGLAGSAAAAAAGGGGGVPAVPLAGGRAEVHHEVLDAVHGPAEVLLRCYNPYKGSELWVHLSHPWCDCSVAVGDKANIIGGTRTVDAEGRMHAYMNHGNGMFVLHPDVLLSGTAITTALGCVRRAWLSERFAAAGGGPGAAATRGTLLHELLQRLLVEVVGADVDAELPGVEQLEKMVLELLASSGEKLHEVGLTEEGAAREMNRHLAHISAWLRQYLPQQQQQQQQQAQPVPQQQQQQWHAQGYNKQGWVQGQQQQQGWQQQQQPWQQQRQQQQQQHGRQLVMQPPQPWQQQQPPPDEGGPVDVGPNTQGRQRPRVLIRGVADIEENIWAPRYGLKGQLDASLLIQLTQPDPNAAAYRGGVSGRGYGQGSGSSSWGRAGGGLSGAGRGNWQQQQQGSGWGVGAGSGRGWAGAGSGGCNQASGGSRQQQDWQQWQQYQQQQWQQGRGTGWGGHGTGVASGGSGRDVLSQVDLNQAVAGSGGAGGRVPCTTVTGATAASGGAAGEDGVKVYKGRVSGAAAATRAYTAGRAADGPAGAGGALTQQQKQQQAAQVRSLASGGSRPPAGAGAWGATAQGSGCGSGGWGSGGQAQQQQQGKSELLIVPFEFKTGKDYFSHKAQVSLYLLLMEVRYELGLPPAGLLWNVNSQTMTLVPAKQEELASLLSCRNRVAAHLWQECPPPPAMLGESHTCSRCHSASTCAAVHAVLERGNAESSGMEPEQWQQLAGGVSPVAAAWGSKWVQLLDWEESGGRTRRSEVWALSGAQRQARGGCIAGLKLVKTTTVACSSSGAALAAANPAAAAPADGESEEAAAELEAVVAASQAASQQQQQQQEAAAGECAAPASDPGADVAGQERLYLYTFEQQVQYQHINVGKARQQPQQQQQQQQDPAGPHGTSADKHQAQHGQNRQQQQQQQLHVEQPAAEQAGGSKGGASCSKQQPGADRALQGIAASPGEMLLLSADGLQVNIGRVDVVEVSGSSITVASRKNLQLERFQAAATGSSSGGSSGSSTGSSSVLWRLDQDEAASIGLHQRAAVLRLAADNTGSHVQRLRELIVDLAAPRLRDVSTQPTQQPIQQQASSSRARSSSPQPALRPSRHSGTAGSTGRAGSAPPAVDTTGPAAAAAGAGEAQQGSLVSCAEVFGASARLAVASGESYLTKHGSHLNSNQVAVLRRVMAMRDYCLVLGMPGTGKTSTIVHAIRALVASCASVLVAAYTNSALDNILIKLADSGVHQFLRLGRASSCHTKVREYMPGGERYPHRSTSELQQLAASTPIVGCPCLSAHHPLLATRLPFDVVIVDEAGQITTPAVLPALLRGRSFVLVGDHYQLPPLVLDPRAQAGGLGVSLFRQLCEAHPDAVVKLQQQYRMAGPIMDLANALVYKGQLEAGSTAVARAQLSLPTPTALQEVPAWVSAALDPLVHLAFLDTDGIQPAAAAEDSLAPGGGVINTGEAQLVMQLLSGLLAAGVPAGDVGIISPYKAQVNHLQKLVNAPAAAQPSSSSGSSTPVAATAAAAAESSAADDTSGVEVLTIDRCQGKDKPVILLSFVRSNAKGSTGTLLADAARLNVAITRAKVKLLMVGSASRLRAGVPLLAQLLDWVQGQGSIMQLPPDAFGSK